MNDTQNNIKDIAIDCSKVHQKLDELNRLLLGLNAFGSLDLTDYNVIMDYIQGSFNYTPVEDK